MKKFLALLLALVMVMGLATTAFAAENEGIIWNETERKYAAYQIFAGTQAENSAVLGDVEWGNGINVTTFLPALQTLTIGDETPFAGLTTAAAVAETLANYADKSDVANAFANLAQKHLTSNSTEVAAATNAGMGKATLPSGYYLLVDISTGNETQNPALLQVTNKGNLSITLKTSGAPKFDKDLEDGTDATTAEIGQTVTYVMSAVMPKNFLGYDLYTLTFYDTLSKGLTYNNDAVVEIDGVTVDYFTIDSKVNDNGTTSLTVHNANILDDGKAYENVTVTVTYSATVNSEAVIGSAGNPNDAYLKYSNNPDKSEDTEDTPHDTVYVFVFTLENTKIDGVTKATLANAQFVLLNSAKNKIAVVDTNGKLTGWTEIPEAVDGVITYPANTILTSDGNGLFKVQGLAEGTYYLRETKAPLGYNLLKEDVKVEIVPTITDNEEEQKLTKLVIKVNDGTAKDGDVTSGKVNSTVENNAGSVLPETGGMGTTMFYIFGGTMMMAAVVLLITKKRMADAV